MEEHSKWQNNFRGLAALVTSKIGQSRPNIFHHDGKDKRMEVIPTRLYQFYEGGT
jgi:hypothetical protein